MTVAVISHYKCRLHKVPDWFAERPDRVDAINNQLIASGIEPLLAHYDAPLASQQQLELAHSPDYLASLMNKLPAEGISMLSDDLPLSKNTLVAAKHAAGSGVYAIDLVVSQKHHAVFCNVRPPGHHAEREQAMGFCFYNNVAIAAAYAKQQYGLERIAIIDFDVHHGNGTQDIVNGLDDILFFSSFQFPLFPNTEVDNVANNICNMKLAETAKGSDFIDSWQRNCLPKLAQYKPQLILISAGFDGHIEDDISSHRLVENDYAALTDLITAYVDSSDECLGIVSMLEGGYNLSALGRSAVAHIKALAKL